MKTKNVQKSKLQTQKWVFAIISAISIFVFLTSLLVIGFIFFHGIMKISWDFIFKFPEEGMMKGGIFPALVGTILLVIGSSILAFPIGILSGIYMNEFLKPGMLKSFIQMMTSNLAGIPSIVYGLFGLALFVSWCGFGVSLLSGCLTLAILVLPIIIRTTDESLKAVDDTYRFTAYSLGAGKIETIFRVILPMAFPSILTSLILSVGRIAGETAPIIFTVVAFYLPEMKLSLDSQVMALPYHLYVMSTSGVDLNASREIAFGTALVLIAMILFLNVCIRTWKTVLNKRNFK